MKRFETFNGPNHQMTEGYIDGPSLASLWRHILNDADHLELMWDVADNISAAS